MIESYKKKKEDLNFYKTHVLSRQISELRQQLAHHLFDNNTLRKKQLNLSPTQSTVSSKNSKCSTFDNMSDF